MTVGLEDSVTVLVTAVERATVTAVDGVTVATEDNATTLLVRVT